MHYIKNCVSILFLALVGACMQLQAQAPQYNVTVLLKDAKPYTTTAYSMNNLGDIVGEWAGSAFLYTDGIMMDLGNIIGGYSSVASDINDKGEIVGWVSNSSTGPSNAFIFSLAQGEVKRLDSRPSVAYAINNAGQIVGGEAYSEVYNYYCPTIFLQNGAIISLGSCDSGTALATDINDYYTSNDLGQIVGGVIDSSNEEQGFLYDGKVTLLNISTELCPNITQAGRKIIATRINNVGQILGTCYTFFYPISTTVNFIYNATNGYAYGLGEYDSIGDINDIGWVVGGGGPYSSPFKYIDGVFYNFYELIPSGAGITSLSPVAINNQGQVAANTNLGPVLLTPIETR